jgi:glycosyltransferase involved in cell wall biosynthesis
MDLGRFLSEQGVEVALAIIGRPLSQAQIAEARLISNLSLHRGDHSRECPEDHEHDGRQGGSWLLDLEQEFSPDVIHLNAYLLGSLPWRAPTLMVCHSCAGTRWESIKGEPLPLEWEPYLAKAKLGLAASDMVIGPSRSMLKQAEGNYGPFKRSKTIPNGRDARDFVPKKKEPFVFSADRYWDEAKNLASLNAAASHVSWPIYVAGEPGRNPSDAVTKLGEISTQELAFWMAKASIYALPAQYEPFGLSVLEAALSGCALVLGDIASLRENWTGCAIFVDPTCPHELALAVQSLIEDEDLRKTLGRNAQARGWTFGIAGFGKAYLEAYRELAATTSATGHPSKFLCVEKCA